MPWNSEHIKWLVDTGEQLKTTDGKEVEVWRFRHEKDEAVLSSWAKHFRVPQSFHALLGQVLMAVKSQYFGSSAECVGRPVTFCVATHCFGVFYTVQPEWVHWDRSLAQPYAPFFSTVRLVAWSPASIKAKPCGCALCAQP